MNTKTVIRLALLLFATGCIVGACVMAILKSFSIAPVQQPLRAALMLAHPFLRLPPGANSWQIAGSIIFNGCYYAASGVAVVRIQRGQALLVRLILSLIVVALCAVTLAFAFNIVESFTSGAVTVSDHF